MTQRPENPIQTRRLCRRCAKPIVVGGTPPVDGMHAACAAECDAKAKKATERFEEPGRLPAGSVKHLVWDGQRWFGQMSVPENAEMLHFTFEVDSEKKCYHGLDAAYRSWLAEQPKGDA